MNTWSTGDPNGLMALPSVGAESREVATYPFRPRFPLWIRAWAAMWSEERERALVADHRYEVLRVGREADLARYDRAAKARRIFLEMYADKNAASPTDDLDSQRPTGGKPVKAEARRGIVG